MLAAAHRFRLLLLIHNSSIRNSISFVFYVVHFIHRLSPLSYNLILLWISSVSTIQIWFGPRQANLVLIAYASSEGSGEPAHPRSLARTFAARSYKQWVKRNLQTESQISGTSEWLGMRSYNLSWRNARRHKFAWRGPFYVLWYLNHNKLGKMADINAVDRHSIRNRPISLISTNSF